MTNNKIIQKFEELVKYISMQIDEDNDKKVKTTNIFRLKQISAALNIIRNYPNKIENGEQLKDIKGIGKGIIKRINEILETGELEEIKIDPSHVDVSQCINDLKEVYGIGDVKARELVLNYGYKTVNDVKRAVSNNDIVVNNNVLMGLKYHGVYKPKIPRSEMDKMEKYIRNSALQIHNKLNVIVCGSYRRGKPFSNDIDCMITHPKIITQNDMQHKKNYLRELINVLYDDRFIIDAITGYDVDTKFMGFCKFSKSYPVRRIDIRYVPYESYYPALLYFTGSGTFNRTMRQTAKKMGYKLNEYGLYKKTGTVYERIDVNSEEDIFDKLNMEYVEPQNRM